MPDEIRGNYLLSTRRAHLEASGGKWNEEEEEEEEEEEVENDGDDNDNEEEKDQGSSSQKTKTYKKKGKTTDSSNVSQDESSSRQKKQKKKKKKMKSSGDDMVEMTKQDASTLGKQKQKQKQKQKRKQKKSDNRNEESFSSSGLEDDDDDDNNDSDDDELKNTRFSKLDIELLSRSNQSLLPKYDKPKNAQPFNLQSTVMARAHARSPDKKLQPVINHQSDKQTKQAKQIKHIETDDNDGEDEPKSMEEKEDGNEADNEEVDWDAWKSPKMFLGDKVYSHLPSFQHNDLILILKTFAKLKGEVHQKKKKTTTKKNYTNKYFILQRCMCDDETVKGFRKIAKKFEKQCSRKLSWPQIKLFEFTQEKKNESYINQCVGLLTTRVIPFDCIDGKLLREKGLNLQQVAMSIQKLENSSIPPLVLYLLQIQTKYVSMWVAFVFTSPTSFSQIYMSHVLCVMSTFWRILWTHKDVKLMPVDPRSYLANERTFLKWTRLGA
ncbi:hypothetical protein RFI_01794 [Reticulomyxa filosa]|uniref:Uncharacterized protein n=1 Tax=Reticulomyxa filosa TaxID=46433 RepID=X6PAU5_RETFI|nr:hypothetical protein RFI_01794 [Reticulomyxa filosa]|eukprot:ETO35271.1 hypothetical protein RFI_01794 [Reticulomyxa filosa]